MAKRKTGRSKGGRNKGYWFRVHRGWYVTEGRSAIPLCDEQGNHIKSSENEEEAKSAYARYVLKVGQRSKRVTLTTLEACRIYLDNVQSSGSPETYRLRVALLFDFCTGFPARFRESKTRPTPKDRIHAGYGAKPVMELTRLDVEHWVKAHPGWKSPRPALQAVRRAVNYCRESGLIEVNPIRGLKIPQSGRRVAYITPEVEEAIYRYARPALALAVKVCIKTGTRREVEFASLESRHVEESPKGQRWRFPANESKGRKKERIIYVPDDIARVVRKLIRQHKGKVFRDKTGKPRTRRSLQSAFRWLKRRLQRKGVTPAEPFIPYTCRHTYAKRRLGGYWGPAITLEVLAQLMGNTPKIAFDHYAAWREAYTDPLWNAIAQVDHSTAHETFPAGVGE